MLGALKSALIAAGAVALLAGCQGIPANYVPPAELKNASPAKLQNHVQNLCIKAQRAKQSADTTTLSKACSCYSRAAIRAQDKGELDFLRNNGYFSDSGRPKAQAAFNSCGLK
jgi:hypothetical protein